jgi:hypothetical protein
MKNQSCFYGGLVLIVVNLPASALCALYVSFIGAICCSFGVLCGLVMITLLEDSGRFP